MKTKQRSLWFGLGGSAVIVAAAGRWFFGGYGRTWENIKMAEASQPVFALVYIADEKGYFADEGLNITYDSFTSGRDALASVVSGKNDIATVFETPVVLRSYEGEELSVITSLHHSVRNTAFVGRKDRGISKPRDLRGKRIGVTRNTNAEFFLILFLASHEISPNEVTLVATTPPEMSKVLKAGSVDAVATWNPHLFDAQKAFASDEITTFYSDVYTEISVLAARRKVAEERQEAFRRLLRGLVRAERFLEENPVEGMQLAIRRFPERMKATMPRIWGAFEPTLQLDNVMLIILTDQAQWFKNNGKFAGPMPDFAAVLRTDFLMEIKPEGVTVKR